MIFIKMIIIKIFSKKQISNYIFHKDFILINEEKTTKISNINFLQINLKKIEILFASLDYKFVK